jgi:amidophosphoribosyltransferase
MPAASELVAHGRSEEEICQELGADGLIFQDLEDLIDAIQKKGKSYVDRFDASVFDGNYVTGDVTDAYLRRLEANRNDSAKEEKARHSESIIELYNTA